MHTALVVIGSIARRPRATGAQATWAGARIAAFTLIDSRASTARDARGARISKPHPRLPPGPVLPRALAGRIAATLTVGGDRVTAPLRPVRHR